MNVDKTNVVNVDWGDFNGRLVRTTKLDDGTVLFAVCDIQENILGVKNASDLYSQIDARCKAELILTFVEEYNPQKYRFVTLDGLAFMVYRARKCQVNRYDFVLWAREKCVN